MATDSLELPEGATLNPGTDYLSLPEGVVLNESPEMAVLPEEAAPVEPNFWQKERYIPSMIPGMMGGPVTIGELIVAPLEMGAEIGAGIATLPGRLLAPPLAAVASAAAGQGVRELGKFAGLIPDTTVDQSLEEFKFRVALNLVTFGASTLIKPVTKAFNWSFSSPAARKAAQATAVAKTPGAITGQLKPPVANNLDIVEHVRLRDAEDTITKSGALENDGLFNSVTGKFEPNVAGTPVTFDSVQKNVASHLDLTNPNSLAAQKKEMVASFDDAFNNYNAANPKSPIKGLTREDLGVASELIDEEIKTLKKLDLTKESAEEIDSLYSKLKSSFFRKGEGLPGVKDITDYISDLRDVLTQLKTFDATTIAQKTVGGKESTLRSVGKTAEVVSIVLNDLQVARDKIIDAVTEATPNVSGLVNSSTFRNVDDAIHHLMPFDKALREFKIFKVTAGVGAENIKKAAFGTPSTTTTGNITKAVGQLGDNIINVGRQTGIWNQRGFGELKAVDSTFGSMQEGAARRAGTFMNPTPFSVPLPTDNTLRGASAGAAGMMTPAPMRVSPEQAQVNMSQDLEEIAAESERQMREAGLLKASDKFGINLSAYDSVEVFDDDVFIEDPNDQQEIMAAYKEDRSISRSHYARQASQFNDRTKQNRLLKIDRTKKTDNSKAKIRLIRGSKRQPANYGY